MKAACHTETFPLRVSCAKPGRAWVIRLCTAVIAAIAAVSVPVAAWAFYVADVDLNKAPLFPRLLLAGVACLAAWGIFQCLQEKVISLKLTFDRKELVLTYEHLPSAWREGEIRRVIRIPYDSVSFCRLSDRRQCLLIRSRGYTRQDNGGAVKKKVGIVEFSVQECRDVDFQALLRRYGGIELQFKD